MKHDNTGAREIPSHRRADSARTCVLEAEVARINGYRIENRALMLGYLLAHPCVDCGQTNPVMLDFDHRNPSEKIGNVSELAMREPWRLVLIEVAKCDVRCANCHLRRTAEQFNWRKVTGRPPTSGQWLERVAPTQVGVVSTLKTDGATRQCTGCRLERPMSEFVVENRSTGRRGTRCRACRSAYGKLHYEKHREKYILRTRRPRHTQRDSYWFWLMNYLASHPCVDCGQTGPIVLQFDHRDGTAKVGTVGAMLSRASWATLLNEIAKCDVRCANCHRLGTAETFGWSKWIGEPA